MRSIAPIFIASLVVAIAGLIQPHPAVLSGPDDLLAMYFRVFGPAALWLVLLVVALGNGRRGLWLLIGAPIVLFWPIWFTVYSLACTVGGAPC
jgi:hypothetical protein